MSVVDIYTDGACSGNPGKGGYAFIILSNGKEVLKMSGCSQYTTNNRMELTAVVRALEHLEILFNSRILTISIFSDSAYCINPVEKGWLKSWNANNWQSKDCKMIKNADLWLRLYNILNNRKYKIKFVKVKGHSGIRLNEAVDVAAKNAIKRLNDVDHFQAKEVQK